MASFAQRLACAGMVVSMDQVLKSLNVKIAYYDPCVDPARPEYNEHCIFVFWHENLTVLLPQWPRCPVTLLISQHRDAGWLKHVADLWGFRVVRGSTTRGGAEAIRQLKKLKSRTSFAITPDGPQGPRQEMGIGALFLASRLQMPLVPVGVGYDRPWRLNTWDQFALPRPFSRARVVFGPKIRLDRDLGRDALEHTRFAVQELLASLNDFAIDWAATNARVQQQLPFVRARRCQQLEFAVAPQQPQGPVSGTGVAA
jgi:lysophospholipid acyltransferase (LPLAT)-like uncharacterized protein